jgi:hypothetical protein
MHTVSVISGVTDTDLNLLLLASCLLAISMAMAGSLQVSAVTNNGHNGRFCAFRCGKRVCEALCYFFAILKIFSGISRA